MCASVSGAAITAEEIKNKEKNKNKMQMSKALQLLARLLRIDGQEWIWYISLVGSRLFYDEK